MASGAGPIFEAFAFPVGDAENVRIDYTAADGSLVDATGYSATWSFGAYGVDGSRGPALVTKATADGSMLVSVSGGASAFLFTVQPADTASRPPGVYWTRLDVYRPDGSLDGGADGQVTLLIEQGAGPGAAVEYPGATVVATAYPVTADTNAQNPDGTVIGSPEPSFGTLAAQVLDYLDRPELSGQVPTWIRLFQAKLNRLLRVGGGEAQASLVPSPITGGAALPGDYQAWRSLTVPFAGRAAELEYVTPSVADRWAHGCSGLPRAFTIRGTTLFPLPVGGPVLLLYYRGVPAYRGAIFNDWVLLANLDLYLYGVLTEAELYLKNDERAQMWEARTANALADLLSADRDARWGRARILMTGATP